MDRNDQHAIETLFERLADVERTSPPRDAEAEAFIRDRVARQPGAPYYMAQTIVVQEQALSAAEARIEELEREAASRQSSPGGLLSGIFGDTREPSRAPGSVPRVGRPADRASPRPFPQVAPGRSGGGFLAGAAQTAMGVAGGLLLGNLIAGMLEGDEKQAAEPQPDEAQAEDAGHEDSGFDVGGFDGFDI